MLGVIYDINANISVSSIGGSQIPINQGTTETGDQPLVIALDLDIGLDEGAVIFRLPMELVTVYGSGTVLNQASVITKDYVIDYASALANVIMETESGAGSLTYRYIYGLQKLSVSVSPVTTGAGNLIQNGRVKLWYHQDRLGSTDFLTDNISGKVTSYAAYDDWGAPTMKAILKLGLRELDLVTNYTGHPYDPVLGVYYAKARMYDAADRRWLSPDQSKGFISDPGTLILYTYVLNNPLLYVDSTGFAPEVYVNGQEIGNIIEVNGKLYGSLIDLIGSVGGYHYERMTRNQNGVISYEYVAGVATPDSIISFIVNSNGMKIITSSGVINRGLYFIVAFNSRNSGWKGSASHSFDVLIDVDYFLKLMCDNKIKAEKKLTIDTGPSFSTNLFIQTKVRDFFISRGFSSAQTAGVMGNAEQESSWNPLSRGRGSQYWGLFQLKSSLSLVLDQKYREAGLDMTKYGYSVSAYQSAGAQNRIPVEDMTKILDVQLKYIYGETPAGANWITPLRAATSAEEAAEVFLVRFEGASANNKIDANMIRFYKPYIGYYYQETALRRAYAKKYDI